MPWPDGARAGRTEDYVRSIGAEVHATGTGSSARTRPTRSPWSRPRSFPPKTEKPREPPLPVAGVPTLSHPILGSSCSRCVHRRDPGDDQRKRSRALRRAPDMSQARHRASKLPGGVSSGDESKIGLTFPVVDHVASYEHPETDPRNKVVTPSACAAQEQRHARPSLGPAGTSPGRPYDLCPVDRGRGLHDRRQPASAA
jgi:hypothetical protein